MDSADSNQPETMDGTNKQPDHNYVYNPCDMNTTDFNPDIYMNKILKDFRLSELMDTEQMLYRQIQTLDSEMQTLIYENYNKFISATETVKKMTSHFDKMEYELDSLAENMNLITKRSNEIAKNLSTKREQMTQMAAKNNLLAKIQFILELPNKMKHFIQQQQFKEAVDDYLNARYSLDKYSNQPSFKNIQMECNQMLEVIKNHFYQQLANENSTSAQVNESIGYLAKLNECPTNLCEKYLQMCEKKLVANLDEIKKQTEMDTGLVQPDILEFIDNVCNNYLSSLNESIAFYSECFLRDDKRSQVSQEVEQMLKEFVDLRMEDLFEVILGRIKKEQKSPNHNIIMFVRALDKFYRRIQSLNHTIGFTDFSEKSLKIIHESTRDQCNHLLADLNGRFQEELSNVRHDFINDIGKPNDTTNAQNKLSDTVIAFETSICENLKSVLSNLNPFLYNEATFINKEFKDQIFGDLLVKYIQCILESAEEYAENYSTSHVPPCLILFLSKICLDLSDSIISYLFRFTEDLFKIAKLGNRLSTPLVKRARTNAQRLLNAYMWTEGQSISHMIRKSVETRDWLSTVEPRSVRSVMKRIIEDISLIDFLVSQLYEEGTRIERSSDNSSRTFSTFSFNKSRYVPQSNWSYGGASSFDNNIASNIQKLFNDKIEIFGKVEFSKLSVTTGIVKIGLKTLIECSRLCTFSRFGFQQMQVDAYYLQTRLWRFASDEKIIVNLIDEVISSTKKRCLDPVGMERSVVENICENV